MELKTANENLLTKNEENIEVLNDEIENLKWKLKNKITLIETLTEQYKKEKDENQTLNDLLWKGISVFYLSQNVLKFVSIRINGFDAGVPNKLKETKKRTTAELFNAYSEHFLNQLNEITNVAKKSNFECFKSKIRHTKIQFFRKRI